MRRALAIDEHAYGADHPNVATSLNNLAQLLQDTNRLGEAEPLMRRALAIDEQLYGPDHPNVASDLNNLAQLLKDTNRLGEAEPLMRRALEIDESAYGPDHPEVAISLNNLAQLLQATNRLGEAEPLMRRALEIDEQSYGPDHPDVAIDLNNLARLLQDTNRLGEAEPLMRRALAINEKSLGRRPSEYRHCFATIWRCSFASWEGMRKRKSGRSANFHRDQPARLGSASATIRREFQSRPAGRNKKAHRFNGGKVCFTKRVPRARHNRATNRFCAVPGDSVSFSRVPTVETVGYHLFSRPRRSRRGASTSPALAAGAGLLMTRICRKDNITAFPSDGVGFLRELGRDEEADKL